MFVRAASEILPLNLRNRIQVINLDHGEIKLKSNTATESRQHNNNKEFCL